MMQNARFTHMTDGTREEYEQIMAHKEEHAAQLPARLMAAFAALKGSFDGCAVDRYQHSLQAATRAHRDGRGEEYVVGALLHDLGDMLAPHNHGELAATLLRPFVSEEICWSIRHHPIFQLYYYGHHIGKDQHARDRFRGHRYYDACVEFCHEYDAPCFDPAYEALPLSFFAPLIERVCSEPRYLERD
jgi:predicted HD phosphohydrolase